MNSRRRCGVLVLNFNGHRWLTALLDSLRADGYQEKRIYLVDNGSTDGSPDMVRTLFPEVIILELKRNRGYSEAYNGATNVAFEDGCEWVVWLNSDVKVIPGWLGRLAAGFESDARIGILGPVFLDWETDEPSRFMVARHGDVVPFMTDGNAAPVDCDWVEGSALAVSRECYRAVGPLDPQFFMYWEEVDYCRRAWRENWRVAIVPGSMVRHFGGGSETAGTLNRLKLKNEFGTVLADPDASFLVNLVRCVHLLMVKYRIGASSRDPWHALWAHTSVFLAVCMELPRWHAKWSRDRRGEHPAPSM